MSHTPTPWVHPPQTLQIVTAAGKLIGNTRSGEQMRFPPTRSRTRRIVPREEAIANAALIVRAVNTYEALVQIAREARSTLLADHPLAAQIDAVLHYLNYTEQQEK